MTHHEKLVERYEDALFALMMEDVRPRILAKFIINKFL